MWFALVWCSVCVYNGAKWLQEYLSIFYGYGYNILVTIGALIVTFFLHFVFQVKNKHYNCP